MQTAGARAAAVPAIPPIVLRPRDAARACGVDVQTLASWPVPRFKFGNVAGYRPADLVRFVARHVTQPRTVEQVWEVV
jgi:hypothetical protein